MFDPAFSYRQSRATEPLFYRAEHPPGMTPHGYQHAGVEYALARDHCLIGDEPGLGKTAQAILICNAIKPNRTLVVCPASLRRNWEREIKRWSTIPARELSIYVVKKQADGINGDCDFVIISYDLLSRPPLLARIMSLHWDHVILDEAHAIKDPAGNKRSKTICAPNLLPSVTGRFTLLSGTILPNQPVECLGPDTPVLTNRGWLRITDVTTSDSLWDGVEWVTHTGRVYQGLKATMGLAGVSLTGNHEIAVGADWVNAAGLTENMFAQALATASENLPSQAFLSAQAGDCWRSLFSAIAAPPLSRPSPLGYRPEGRGSVDPAGQRKGHGSEPTPFMAPFARMNSFALDCLTVFRTSWRDATTPRTPAIDLMGDAGFQCMARGAQPVRGAELSSPIWCPSRATMIQSLRSTGAKSIAGMNRVTFASSRASKTQETSGSSGSYSSGSTNLKPVFDLTNAGPRRRFLILTEKGPLLAHNCYNAVRLLNWDAIDRASLEDFKEKYYDLGGGMVRGPVWDEKLKANISKVHWSDRVRNVPRNMDDLQRRLRSNIMVRRLKIDVADQLPRKEFHLVPLETTAQMRLALKHPGWSAAEQLYDLDPDAFHSDMPVDGAVSTARRLLGEAKVGPACDYVEELLASGVTKLVVSAHHSSVLAVARERLSKFGLAYMDGKTSTDARDKAVIAFQSDPKIRVILGQTQVIGEGHTLTAAQDVCLLEPDYVPGRITQMVDRIHRLGQEGDYVLAHLPIVPGTLDERIVATAIEKDKTIYLALDAE